MNKILVVDNDPFVLDLISKILENSAYVVIKATSGEEGILLAKKEYPNLILINLKLPQIDGINASRITKKYLRNHFVFIILVIDELVDKQVLKTSFPYFDDYIEKPFRKDVFIDKITRALKIANSFQELSLLYKQNKKLLEDKEELIEKLEIEQQSLAAKVRLRTKELNYKNSILSEQNQAIQRDMKITSKLQKNFLPQSTPTLKNYSIYSHYIPMNHIGGDFYDFIEMRENKVGILIGDVSGHGISSAFITSMVKGILSRQRNILPKPALLCEKLNKELLGVMQHHFVTVAYAVFDLDRPYLTFASAGHLPLFLHKKKEDEIISLYASGTVIGILPTVSYKDTKIKLDKGDRILLFTDGLIEVFNKKRELYGVDRLRELFYNTSHIKGKRTIDYILNNALDFSDNKNFIDDVAIIFVEVN